MANLNRLVAASFSSLVLLFSSVSMAILSCLLATTLSSLRLLSNSLSSPCFNHLREARHCISWFFVFLFSRLPLFFSLRSFKFGFNCPKLTLNMHVFGPCNIAQHTYFCMGFPQTNLHTYIYICNSYNLIL